MMEMECVGLDYAMNLIPTAADYVHVLPGHSHTPVNLLGPARRSTQPVVTVKSRASVSRDRQLSIMADRTRKPSQSTNNTLTDLTFKQQFFSMFQPSADNKLALKLFGEWDETVTMY